ncbi:MAG: hypothetical protein IJT54_07905 [Candidatus Methanomethylophilaceae archaeon]|nr:hypothetical protein [Candidatus Methanomethylophilaceae archaeon]
MDAGRLSEVSKGITGMLIIQLTLIAIGAICEAFNLYYILAQSGLEGKDLFANAFMHIMTLLTFGILALYATVGWKKTGKIHFRGVLFMYFITVAANILALHGVISGVAIGLLIAILVFTFILHQKLADERDAELLAALIFILAAAYTITLIVDKVPIEGADVFWKLFRFSLPLMAFMIASDYEGNFDRINFKKK